QPLYRCFRRCGRSGRPATRNTGRDQLEHRTRFRRTARNPVGTEDYFLITALRVIRWLMLFAPLPAWLGAEGGYHLIKRILIPGDYGWDDLTSNTEARRLYVSHDRDVVVLDLDSFAVVVK